jgi:hypothetical protein
MILRDEGEEMRRTTPRSSQIWFRVTFAGKPKLNVSHWQLLLYERIIDGSVFGLITI